MTARTENDIGNKQYKDHPRQRGALHLWMSQCADVLNNQGITIPMVIEALEEYGVNWTGVAVKEIIYKNVLKVQKALESTEDQTTSDVELTRQEIILLVGEKFGVVLPPFPDRFNMGLNEQV